MDAQEDQQPDKTNINSGGGNVNTGNIDADGNVVMGDHNVTNNYYANSPKPVPNQLQSRRTKYFVGRTDHLSTIQNALRPGKKLAIIGPGGMGKTTLALEAIHQMGDQLQTLFPDGIIFHTFYGKSQLALAFESLIGAYEKPAGDPEQQARDVMGGKRALVILDGCEEVRESQGLRRLTDLLAHCGVLITTRKPQHAYLGQRLKLGLLHPDDALVLLQDLASPNPIPDEAGREICELVDHLPLAVDIAGKYLGVTEKPAKRYLNELNDDAIKALDRGESKLVSIERLLWRSTGQISRQGQDILYLMGKLAYQPVPEWLLEGILEQKPYSLQRFLEDMARYGLILWERGDPVCSHALVHGYARDHHLPGNIYESEMIDKPWEWLLEHLPNWQVAPLQFDKCDAVRGHTMVLLGRLEQQKEWEATNKLVWTLGPNPSGYLALQGHFTERLLALEAGVRACQKTSDRQGEGNHLGHLGIAYVDLGRYQEAIDSHERALAISREIGDWRGEGAHLGNLGIAYRNLGRYQEAIDSYERALAISRETGDRRGEGTLLGNLGNAYRNLGRYQEAIDSYERALAISREIGDRRGEGNHLGNLGSAYYSLGRYQEAIDSYEQALGISREIGDRRGEGNHLGNLGTAHADLGEVEKAMSFYEQADDIDVEIGNIQGHAINLANIGLRYKNDLNDPAKAKALWEEALAIFEKIGHPYAENVSGWLNDL